MASTAHQRDKTYRYDWASGEKVSYTGTAASSAALSANTLYCVTLTTAGYITSGSATPTAAAASGSIYLAAGEKFYLWNKTSGYKISAVQAAAGGDMYIVPVL